MMIMRKLLWSLIPLMILFVSSCSTIPTISSPVPPDPVDTEPSIWGDDVQMSLSVDYTPFLNPIDFPKYTRIKLSFLNYTPSSELSENNFKVFEDGRAQGFILSKLSSVNNKVDLVLLIDVTGSMGNVLNGIKNSISSFLNYLSESGLDVRVGVIPFNDFAPSDPAYDPPWLDLSDFTTAENYVNNLNAQGGGDYPENSYGAIMFAWENVSWRKSAQRVFILFTDAYSHYAGEEGAESFSPEYAKEDVLKALMGRATLYMVAASGYNSPYDPADTDFSQPQDPREIAVETGGFVIYQSGAAAVDLTDIGIAESVVNTYYITFQSDSPSKNHVIKVYYKGPSGEEGQAVLHASY